MNIKEIIRSDRYIYIIFILLIIFLFTKKVDFHMDELLTYNLANAESWFNPENGKKFTPANQPFIDAITSKGEINLKNVWKQQSNDTHPPFYYILVHFICTLFPNTFSMWYAAVINIFFQILILWIYRKILLFLLKEKKIINIFSYLYILNSGILSITLFLRMYVMLMFWVALFTYLVLKYSEKFRVEELLLIGGINICGTLTHYYFIVYAFFVSLSLIVILLYKKNYKGLITYSCIMFVSEGISYLIFPSMIRHIFLTGRGTQSIEKLSYSNLWTELDYYYKFVNNEIFGGILSILLLIILIEFIFMLWQKGKNNKKIISSMEIQRYFLMIFPIVGYIIIIAKTSPMNVERYVSLVYPIVILIMISMLYKISLIIIKDRKRVLAFQSILIITIVVLSFFKCEWSYVNIGNKERLESAEIYGKGTEAVCLYRNFWDINTAFKEISKCDSVTFYNITTYEEFIEKCNVDKLGKKIGLFQVGIEIEMFIEKFIEDYPQYAVDKDNGKYEFVQSVYLSRD